jgi:hypothetical protein
MKKPTWIVQKEREKREAAAQTIWLFGIHAVRDALLNPKRTKLRLLVTKNACDRLGEAIAEAGLGASDRRSRASFRHRLILSRCIKGRLWRSKLWIGGL